MKDTFLQFSFIPLLALIFGEIYFSGKFIPNYFRYGIPGFTSRVPVAGRPDMDRLLSDLSDKFQGGFWSSAMIFKPFSPNEIGFREKMGFAHRSSSLMRGIIQFVPQERAYVITGRFNWTALIVGIVLVKIALDSRGRTGGTPFLIVPAILVIFYIVDVFRYRRIAKEIAAIRP